MKLKNKKTGGIVEVVIYPKDKYGYADTFSSVEGEDSLAELNEVWEDCEEPNWWSINGLGAVEQMTLKLGGVTNRAKQIGNYFETKEEAEKAVEKLKAWKRLKDKGFRLTNYRHGLLLDETVAGQFRYEFPIDNKDDIDKDLDLLFGGEEC